jgi:signal transduction histidine kinase/CheY-like chemotaxis protein
VSGIPADSSAAWDRHSLGRERATFATANLLIGVLVPVWSLFDFYLEPRLAPRFLVLRGTDVALTLVLAKVIARSSDLRRRRLAMVASVLAVGLAIVAMLAQVGPANYALYAFGFSLVFWGTGLLLVWPPRYSAGAFGGLLVAHVLSYGVSRNVALPEFVGALFYLGSAAIISCAQSAVRRRLEREAFEATYTLGARNTQLASTVAVLDATQARLLASGEALAESLDVRTTAERVVAIAVPTFASWATLTVSGPEGAGPVHAAAHEDASLLPKLKEAIASEVVGPAGTLGVERIADAGREDVARTAGVRASELVAARSLLVAPLVARGLRVGTLVLGRIDRSYDANDTTFAEELARRASLALDNARLYAIQQSARDLADAASRAKDEFLASVSHELRTPLSAILGWAKLLALPGLQDKKRTRAVETIERNAVAMAQLIEDLLDVSRIVSGKFRLEMDRVEPAAVVEAAIESVRPAAEAKSIRIVSDFEAGVGAIQGDAARLQQVVWNLVSNAVKFTPAGGQVRVELRAHAAPHARQRAEPNTDAAPHARQRAEPNTDAALHVEIVVRDTGKGIDPRFLPHVFEPFRQAETTVARPTSGLGLGLAIVKHIVELHGGLAEAFSDGVGRGAIFTVRLPLLVEPATERASSAPPRPFQAPAPLEGLRVLVVEDEADMRQLVEDVLTSCGSRVVTASSVAEAMGRFEAGDIPDVLISDIGMEDESGYDLIRRVRSRPPSDGGNVPAAALTAYTRAEDRRKVLRAGFELHVPKPVEPAELVSVVATLAKFVEER